jgi:hypothetical protein
MSRERDRAWGEGSGDACSGRSPFGMLSHQFGLRCDISWREMIKFESLGFNPTQRLEVFEQEIVFGKLRWKFNVVIASPLRDPCNGLFSW